MMVVMACSLPLLLLLSCCWLSQADKDDSYYIAGTGNPNVEQTMYWKDAENVLQDLSKFSSLYVVFHHCAWTWMQPEDQDNNVEENDYWYMGKIPPMGANVAFSLYGSLTGRTFGGCNSATFINSFYTKTGFEKFAQAMYKAGVTGFGYYSYGNDDDQSSTLTSACKGYSGVGCNSNYGFAVHSYSTALCDPQKATAVTDQLIYLNKAMQASQCIKIYSSSYSSSYYNQGGYNQGGYNQGGYNQGGYNQGGYSQGGYNQGGNDQSGGNSGNTNVDEDAPLSLLLYSSACFYQNFWSPDGECPDPYGKIKYYQENFYKGIEKAKLQRPVAVYRQKEIYEAEIRKGQSRLALGIVFVASAVVLLIADKIWSVWRKRREQARSAKKAAEAADPMSVGSTVPSHQSKQSFEYRQHG